MGSEIGDYLEIAKTALVREDRGNFQYAVEKLELAQDHINSQNSVDSARYRSPVEGLQDTDVSRSLEVREYLNSLELISSTLD